MSVRPLALCLVATSAVAGVVLSSTPTALADDRANTGEVEVSVEIPEAGSLGLELTDSVLELGLAALNEERTAWVAQGELPALTVTDSRVTMPGWELTAQVSPFTGPEGTTLDQGVPQLTLAPQVTAASAQGVEVTEPGDVTADPAGLLLARLGAGLGTGITQIGGTADFSAPAETDPGIYTAVLTLTVS